MALVEGYWNMKMIRFAGMLRSVERYMQSAIEEESIHGRNP